MLPTLRPSSSSSTGTGVPSGDLRTNPGTTTTTTAAAPSAQDTAPEPPQTANEDTHVTPRAAEAWGIDFSLPKTTRKTCKKEREALLDARLRRLARGDGEAKTQTNSTNMAGRTTPAVVDTDNEGNVVCAAPSPSSAGEPSGHTTTTSATATTGAMRLVQLDGLEDRDALIPRHLTITRAELETRFVLRQPRLLCVNKQYPRSCGVSSLASIYNYLYSWLGESEVGRARPPVSQEEVMSILGFEPPFGDIHWGPFTGNGTLIRWFHALNQHFGLEGKASILYKEHGKDKTTHLYNSTDEALAAVKAALRDPHCALIYHCHNHYMVPVGFQDIPLAQTDFFQQDVPAANCETTVFIGEVSRGRHEAMYARRWAEIVKDIQCASPEFFNIRHTELGVQRKETRSTKKATNAADKRNETTSPPPPPPQDDELASGGSPPAECVTPTETTSDKPLLPKRPPREPNNLHCLILFRNDVAETHLERFAQPPDVTGNDVERDRTTPVAEKDDAQSSTSSSSSSDEEQA